MEPLDVYLLGAGASYVHGAVVDHYTDLNALCGIVSELDLWLTRPD